MVPNGALCSAHVKVGWIHLGFSLCSGFEGFQFTSALGDQWQKMRGWSCNISTKKGGVRAGGRKKKPSDITLHHILRKNPGLNWVGTRCIRLEEWKLSLKVTVLFVCLFVCIRLIHLAVCNWIYNSALRMFNNNNKKCGNKVAEWRSVCVHVCARSCVWDTSGERITAQLCS